MLLFSVYFLVLSSERPQYTCMGTAVRYRDLCKFTHRLSTDGHVPGDFASIVVDRGDTTGLTFSPTQASKPHFYKKQMASREIVSPSFLILNPMSPGIINRPIW